jgi:hypothetical protein
MPAPQSEGGERIANPARVAPSCVRARKDRFPPRFADIGATKDCGIGLRALHTRRPIRRQQDAREQCDAEDSAQTRRLSNFNESRSIRGKSRLI